MCKEFEKNSVKKFLLIYSSLCVQSLLCLIDLFSTCTTIRLQFSNHSLWGFINI
uniref:Uncharacterized protein n=1 Tax=Anguilla anguilla TaxID=7936 RepID=A0A0E9X087_ANGAN